MSGPVQIIPITGLPEVVPGHDLAELITDHADLADGDVVVVAQKIVSKAEGALVSLQPGEDVDVARRRLARSLARRVVADAPWALIVETAHGLVCANAGLDASNVPGHALVRLPDDPDASAARLREGVRARAGVDVAVIISDTFGRPWRLGQTDVAIGAAGMAVIRAEEKDREGRALAVTEPAIADEAAAAADLVRGKADGVAVVVLRGLEHARDETAGAVDLVRSAELDLFPRGRGMLAAALAAGPVVPIGEPAAEALAAALSSGMRAGGGRVELSALAREASEPARIAVVPDARDAELAAGAAAATLVAACLDLGLIARMRPPAGDEPGAVVVEIGAEPEPALAGGR